MSWLNGLLFLFWENGVLSFHGGCPYDTMVSKWSWQDMALYGAHLFGVLVWWSHFIIYLGLNLEDSLLVIYMNHKVGMNDMEIDIDGHIALYKALDHPLILLRILFFLTSEKCAYAMSH